MGCDGGTIPRRDELVRQKKKPEQKDKNAETVAKWKHCAISQEPLRKPIAACELGKLYNKEAVIEHILNKGKASTSTDVASHIFKMSDIKALNLTEKPDFKPKTDKGDEYVDFNNSRYICPVTGLDMNGRQKFYLLWKCGCVLSERAIKEVKSENCHKCGMAFTDSDIIILNGTDEETSELKNKMLERRKQAKLEKKKKKFTASETEAPSGKKAKHEAEEAKPSTSGLSNGKIENGIKSESQTNGNTSGKGKNLPEKAQSSYSIAKDPSASAAYKSLFTSHHTAKNQDKAHWVTHNPCYY